jgi:hypothetical protein
VDDKSEGVEEDLMLFSVKIAFFSLAQDFQIRKCCRLPMGHLGSPYAKGRKKGL